MKKILFIAVLLVGFYGHSQVYIYDKNHKLLKKTTKENLKNDLNILEIRKLAPKYIQRKKKDSWVECEIKQEINLKPVLL